MSILPDRRRRHVPLFLGVVTLVSVALLFVQDAFPRSLPGASHSFLAAFSLAMIALAYVTFQIVQGAALADMAKAALLAAAFLFWAANQYWPASPQAPLFNDIAIGLFVLDVFLAISGWPRPPEEPESAERDPSANAAYFGNARCTSACSGKRCC